MIHCCNAHSHLAWSAGQVLADEPTQCSNPVTYVCPKSTVSLTQEQLQPFVLEALKQVARVAGQQWSWQVARVAGQQWSWQWCCGLARHSVTQRHSWWGSA